MSVVGRVDGLWRYPVKSMRGQEINEAFLGVAGLYGDRLFALRTSMKPDSSPYLTGQELPDMVLYIPRFYDHETTVKPTNFKEDESAAPSENAEADNIGRLSIYVESPAGDLVDLEDDSILHTMNQSLGGDLSLMKSAAAMADNQPLCLISLQTGAQLSEEVGENIDQRRFRANIYMDLGASAGFTEDDFVGKKLRIGSTAVISIIERAQSCKMMSIDPETSEKDGKILRSITKTHEGKAGIYAEVLVEGMAQKGDEIILLE